MIMISRQYIVEVANNILHQHNEQEFIVAQKVF